MSRRRHPGDPPTEMAHIVPAIAGCAERRELVVSPAFMRHAIGRTTLFSIAVAEATLCIDSSLQTADRARRTSRWQEPAG